MGSLSHRWRSVKPRFQAKANEFYQSGCRVMTCELSPRIVFMRSQKLNPGWPLFGGLPVTRKLGISNLGVGE